MIVALGLPRGKQGPQGEPGPKGEPGDASNVPVATASRAGIVKSNDDIRALSDGTLSLHDKGRWYSVNGVYASPFDVGTILTYKGMGSFFNPLVTFTPNPLYSSRSVTGPVEVKVLSDNYQFTSDARVKRMSVTMLASTENFVDGMTWVEARVTPVPQSANVTVGFFQDTTTQTAYNLRLGDGTATYLCSPSFTCLLGNVREV